MDEMIISIGDLMAVLARKGKQIICCGIVFALLLGGFKGFNIWRSLNDEEYINFDQAAYEYTKLNLERSIEATERAVSDQEGYLTNSLWMQINPYDKHTTELYLLISGIDESDVSMTFGDTTTPRDYLLNRITSQYSIFWSAEDLQQSLGIPKYKEVLDKYIRELVWISFLDGGIIRVSAIGATEEQSKELAHAASTLLMSKLDVVRENSFNHTISLYNTVQQNQIDTGMVETQYARRAQIDAYNKSIIEAKQTLKELEEPESIKVSVVKMIIIGGILGGILACAWYLIRTLLAETLQSSTHMERSLSIPFGGCLMKQKGPFQWLANLFSSERVWKNDAQALEYVVEMVKLRLPGQRLLIASTLSLAKDTDWIEKLRAALTASGIQVEFKEDVLHDPGTPVALNGCDGVLLLEQTDNTKIDQARKVYALAEECKKNVIGFVLV